MLKKQFYKNISKNIAYIEKKHTNFFHTYISDYGKPAEEKEALTVSQQEKFMEFVKQSNAYNTYYPMFTIMIGTGLRCGVDWSYMERYKHQGKTG